MLKNRTTQTALRVALLVFAFSESAGAADKVRISVSSLDAAFLTPIVALKRGFFKEEDIDPEIIRMNANISITAWPPGILITRPSLAR